MSSLLSLPPPPHTPRVHQAQGLRVWGCLEEAQVPKAPLPRSGVPGPDLEAIHFQIKQDWAFHLQQVG